MPIAQPGSLETIAGNRGSTSFAYLTNHPPEMVAADGYWLPVADRLRRGDTIRLTIVRDDLFGVADLVVIEAARDRVRVVSVDMLQREMVGDMVIHTMRPEPPLAQVAPVPAQAPPDAVISRHPTPPSTTRPTGRGK